MIFAKNMIKRLPACSFVSRTGVSIAIVNVLWAGRKSWQYSSAFISILSATSSIITSFMSRRTCTTCFQKQLSYNRFVELESRVAVEMMLFLQLFCFGRCTGISFFDSTCIPVCHNKRITRNKVFRDYAERGKSTMGWYFGFKLHLICNERGELLNFIPNPNDRFGVVLKESPIWSGAFRSFFKDKPDILKNVMPFFFINAWSLYSFKFSSHLLNSSR